MTALLNTSWNLNSAVCALVALLAFSLAMPTAWISIATGLFLLLWLLDGRYRNKFDRVRGNRFVLLAMLLLMALLLGSLYSSAEPLDVTEQIGSYLKLLLIPLIISMRMDEKWRRLALIGFMSSVLLVLSISYLQYLGWFPLGPPGEEFTNFKGRISHNLFMAFAAYVVADSLLSDRQYRYIKAVVFALMAYNVFFMIEGRTGQIILLALILLIVFQRGGWRSLVAGSTLIAVLLLGAWNYSDRFQERVIQTAGQISAFTEGRLETIPDYSRLILYVNSVNILMENPVFGSGTGSYSREYARELAKGSRGQPSDNPHNEYINLAVQLGIVGAVLFVALLVSQWRCSRQLEGYHARHVQALVVVMSIGCLFNSLLMDHGEGFFYVVLSGIYLSGLTPGRGVIR